MLTPASNDPKRKEELNRKKDNPTAFGSDIQRSHEVKHEGSGLVVDRAKDEASQQQQQQSTDLDTFLAQSVDAITQVLETLTVEQLNELRAAEEAGKNRTTLLKAVDEELATRDEE